MGCYFEDKKECIVKATNFIVPGKIIDKLSETIVRIEINKKISTGFFMKIKFEEIFHNFLLTCAHSITQEEINSKLTISLFYGEKEKEIEKKIELDDNKRFIKSFDQKNFDATIIEILPEDKIPENKYLYPDLNYKNENGFENYFQKPKVLIYTGGYPDVEIYKDEKHYSGGEIVAIKYDDGTKKNFLHDCSTKEGSSGSPLINSNQQVIGIHHGCNNKKTINYGLFVGAIINYLDKEYEKNKFIFKSPIIINEAIEVKESQNKINKKNVNNIDNVNNSKDGVINININKKGIMKNKENKEVSINNKDIINNSNINKQELKKEGDDTLVKMLSKGETNNINKGTDMALMGQIFNNPSFMNITKTLSKDPKMLKYLDKMPEIQKLKETNPIFKEALKNKELMKKITNRETSETFHEITNILNNNKIDDPKIFEDKFNQLKNMGFKDDDLIREALLLCKGNIDEAIEYINSAKKEDEK